MDQYCAFDGQCSASSVQTSSTDPTGLAGLSPLTTTPASGSNGETSPSPTEASATPTVAFSTSTSEITTSMINSTLTGAKTSARTSVTVPPAVGTHSASFTTSSVSTRPSSQDSSSDRAGPVPPSPGQIAGIVLGGLLLIILLGLLWTVLRYSIGPGIKSPVSILRAALALPPRLEDGPSNGDYGEEMKVTTRHAYQGQKRSRHWYGTPKRRHSLSNEDISPEHFSSGSNSSMSWTSRGPTQKARLYDLLIDILLGESSRRRGQSDHGEGSEVSATEICRDWARRTVESVSPVRRTTRPFRRAISPTSRDSPNLGLKTLSLPSEASRPDVDIVFVHGLTGNSHSTWFHEKRQIHWPTALLGRSLGDEGVNARIFAFGYDANVVNLMGPASRNRIGNHAINLLGALARRRETSTSVYRKIVFVAHSLGGLVVQDALAQSRNSAEPHIRQIEHCTMGLLFLGTPHHGANLAAWASLASRMTRLLRRPNSDIVDVLTPGSEVLSRIQREFNNFLRTRQEGGHPISVTCFYEELPVAIVGEIVPRDSATIHGYEAYGIHADHKNMTKFRNTSDPGYKSVFEELLRWTQSLGTLRSRVDLRAERPEDLPPPPVKEPSPSKPKKLGVWAPRATRSSNF